MNTSYQVYEIINKYKNREPIFIKDLGISKQYRNARDCAIHKLQKRGIIKQYRRGIYYKPEKTIFGELGIDKEKLIRYKYIKQKNGKIEGYITGPTVWYNLNLTTQIPNRTWIVTNKAKENSEDRDLNIRIIKPKKEIKIQEIKYYELLDIIDQHKLIQDINLKNYNFYILDKLQSFNCNDIKVLKRIAKKYNKNVTNILGFYLELLEKTIRKTNNQRISELIINGIKTDYKVKIESDNDMVLNLGHTVKELKNSITSSKKYKYKAIDSELKKEWELY